MVLIKNALVRPFSLSPKYPPYHTGLYLEEYFLKKWNEKNLKCHRKYIDVLWTNIFCNSMNAGLEYKSIQQDLDNDLDQNGSYFTVCQFDDGPFENFPEDTLIFSAGGNRKGKNIIPIPLICAPIPKNLIPKKEKSVFASFVGSLTHQIRYDMKAILENNPDYHMEFRNWTNDMPIQDFNNFIEITCSSKFALAPRGYGTTSFRLYEILQLGAVPVYISDEHSLPFSNEINWDSFCVLIKWDQLKDIDRILKSISEEKYSNLLENGKLVYKNYFTLNAVFDNIVKVLNNNELNKNIPDPTRNKTRLIWDTTYEWTCDFIRRNPTLKVGAEIGVAGGQHIKNIIETTQVEKMYGIDPYISDSWDMHEFFSVDNEYGGFDNLYNEVKQMLSAYGNKVELIRKTSKDAYFEFEDESLDFVFIDAFHDYENCFNDITFWHRKVRKGGYVMGHDWDHPLHPGVQRAVEDFYGKGAVTGVPHPVFVWYIQK